MKLFVLEDSSERLSGFIDVIHSVPSVHVDVRLTTSVDRAKALWNPPYDLVCLDHDLTPKHYELFANDATEYPLQLPDTGHAFVKWLLTPKEDNGAGVTPKDVDLFVLHTLNYKAARVMQAAMLLADLHVIQEPYGKGLLAALKQRLRVERERVV
jgi:hypothetical protein